MTGPEHYRHAERWAYKAAHADARGAYETSESCAAIAQAHATLALAAASALNRNMMPPDDRDAWDAAAATLICRCPAGMKFHATNCPVSPSAEMATEATP